VTEQPRIIRLDGKDYDIATVPAEAMQIVARIGAVEKQLKEKQMLIETVDKARVAYLAEIKAEIVRLKSGVDLSSIFTGE
jgi:hypothetical protein